MKAASRGAARRAWYAKAGMEEKKNMEYLVDGKQAALVDRFSIDQAGIPSLVLMERASLSCAQEIRKYLDGSEKDLKVLSVCGSGNNGGDGMAAARILHTSGFQASILLVGKREKLSVDAKKQLDIASFMGLDIIFGDEWLAGAGQEEKQEKMEGLLGKYDILVDAIFGTGLSREIGGTYRDWVEAVNAVSAQGKQVFAVDIASGVSSADGQILGTAVRADVTVTFGYRKLGMLLYPGALFSGRIVCAEIGFDPNAIHHIEGLHIAYGPEDLGRLPARRQDSNKGTYGKTLIIAGSRNMAGAAAFSARAAYYMGAGLVTIYTPESNRVILQQLIPEAVMKTYPDHEFDENALKDLLASCSTLVVGPGLGKSDISHKIVHYVLEHAACPLIIDADALNIISEQPQILKMCSAPAAVTPHLMELSRLTGYNIQTLKTNLQKICVDFSHEYGVICISKDARTMIFGDNKDIYVNLSGNNGMSTGGSGDVLTGVIAGLCSQGMDLMEASKLGVYIHGLAGERASDRRGVRSVTASDIAEAIPDILMR